MSWFFDQRTGLTDENTQGLVSDTVVHAYGYSGSAAGKNNPEMETVQNVGPCPRGIYTMGAPLTTVLHGPYAIPLTPDAATETYLHQLGRFGFMIHGDSIEHPGFASDGCIILDRATREKIWNSGDHTLVVWASPAPTIAA